MESIREIVGTLAPSITTVSTDSRLYQANQVFVAIAGVNFDAFTFAEQVLNKGCTCMVLEYSDDKYLQVSDFRKKYPLASFVICHSVELFLAELANRRIVEWKMAGGTVIGITGSNGKTTHKEMLFHLLDSVYPSEIMATEANFNNHFGVPFTILKIKDSDRFAIIEMGSNHPGEIRNLSNIALPDAGIITNIGDSHLEFFLNRENVFVEKRALFDAISCSTSAKKLFIFNGEDSYLKTLQKYDWSLSFGSSDCDVQTNYSVGKVVFNGIEIKNPSLVGKHNYMNMVGCYLLACGMIGHESALQSAALSFIPSMNRSEMLSLGSHTIFLDAYNANPSSMKASIQALIEDKVFSTEKSLFVLGDMNELGESAESLHRDLAVFCRALKIENILFVGRYAKSYLDGWGAGAQAYENTEDLLKNWEKIVSIYPQIFIKGSRTLQLESLADIKYYNDNYT